ncbi:MAG: DUF4065 domain-containing protein [Bacteroidales bacterium]|nr:DUF4065 domain-containing protein [Bacteroidales bacterium]
MNSNKNIEDVAMYVGLSLLSKGLSVSPLKLQKILYYVQCWYMVFFGRGNTLFAVKPQAWVNGPVYPVIYNKYRSKVQGMCDHLQVTDFSDKPLKIAVEDIVNKLSLDIEEIKCIDSIITLYGSRSQNQLILMTHSELPWIEARGDLLPYQYSQKELSLDTMYSYYKQRRENRLKSNGLSS